MPGSREPPSRLRQRRTAPSCIFPEKILKTGLKKISTSCAWSPRKWHISCTVLLIIEETASFIPRSTCFLKYFLQYADEYQTFVIRRTREEMHEETGISVKTLNRTIRKLKESGMVGITKGKVTMNEAHRKWQENMCRRGESRWAEETRRQTLKNFFLPDTFLF